MKKIKILIATIIATSALVNAQTTWNLDKSHSNVRFSVEHLMISETEGQFKLFDGKITAKNDDFTDANIEFTIDVNSINTEDEKRDGHLKSPDFFDAAKYPKITFKSKSFKVFDAKTKLYTLVGDLTIKDVTKSVELIVTYKGVKNDPWGNTKAGFKIKGGINRVDYGLKWNAALEAGGVVVGENVTIECNIELLKSK